MKIYLVIIFICLISCNLKKSREYYADFDTVLMKPIGQLESVKDRKMYVECFRDNKGKIIRLLIHTKEFKDEIYDFVVSGNFLYNETVVRDNSSLEKCKRYLGFGKLTVYKYYAENETDAFVFKGIEITDFSIKTHTRYDLSSEDESLLLPYGNLMNIDSLNSKLYYVEKYKSFGNYLEVRTIFFNPKNKEIVQCFEYTLNSMFWIKFYPEFIFSQTDCKKK